jgi:hypothetical protein
MVIIQRFGMTTTVIIQRFGMKEVWHHHGNNSKIWNEASVAPPQ